MVDGPAGDDGVVLHGGHDVEDVRLLEFEAPALAEAVGGIRHAPPERDVLGDGLSDHRLGHAENSACDRREQGLRVRNCSSAVQRGSTEVAVRFVRLDVTDDGRALAGLGLRIVQDRAEPG